MQKRRLGNSTLDVSVVGLGSNNFGGRIDFAATERALQFFVDNLPPDTIWNVSVMNPEKQWPILALAVALGGHVRVGYEDNPFIAPGEFAKNNAVLVERMVGISQRLGREVATPAEARKILGLERTQ